MRDSREALQQAYVDLIDGLVPKACDGLGGFVYTQTAGAEALSAVRARIKRAVAED